MKTECLGVPEKLLADHGAVSREVAIAMARGALANAQADYALAITGVAGPDGGTHRKPVGTVHIGLVLRKDSRVEVVARHFVFPGERLIIRDRSAKAALQMLRFALLGIPNDFVMLWEVAPTSAHAAHQGACT
jgi:nicotinamide-nucleotide amidase